MIDFIRLLYQFTAGVYTAVNVPLFNGIGFFDVVLGFLFFGLVVAVFWKGVRA